MTEEVEKSQRISYKSKEQKTGILVVLYRFQINMDPKRVLSTIDNKGSAGQLL